MAVLDLCKGLPERKFAKGETLLEEGKRAGLLYILVTGTVEVVKGETQINTVGEPGAFFGEMSVLLDAPHTATVRALERFDVLRGRGPARLSALESRDHAGAVAPARPAPALRHHATWSI